MIRFIVVALAFVWPICAVADATRIEQIQLQNRSAQEMIPLVRPLVGKDGGVSGQGYVLILRATDAQIEDIKNVVRQLDQPARRFIISVEQVNDDNRARDELGADGRVVINNGGASGTVTIRGAKTGERDGGSVRQQVMVSEGSSGYIQFGQRIPEGTRLRFAPGAGVIFEESSGWIDLATGFHVTPQLLPDDTVQLTIRVRGESPDPAAPHSIRTQNMETSLRIPLNQWVTLGASEEAFQSSGSGIVHRTQSRGNESLVLRIHAAVQ